MDLTTSPPKTQFIDFPLGGVQEDGRISAYVVVCRCVWCEMACVLLLFVFCTTTAHSLLSSFPFIFHFCFFSFPSFFFLSPVMAILWHRILRTKGCTSMTSQPRKVVEISSCLLWTALFVFLATETTLVNPLFLFFFIIPYCHVCPFSVCMFIQLFDVAVYLIAYIFVFCLVYGWTVMSVWKFSPAQNIYVKGVVDFCPRFLFFSPIPDIFWFCVVLSLCVFAVTLIIAPLLCLSLVRFVLSFSLLSH